MCRSEWKDLHERKFKPSEAEERQNQTANKCGAYLKGQLSPTQSEWIEKWRKEK